MPSAFTTENTERTEKNLVMKVLPAAGVRAVNFLSRDIGRKVLSAKKPDRELRPYTKVFSVLSVSSVVNHSAESAIACPRFQPCF